MRYNVWPGNPSGDDEDTSRCIAEVYVGMYNLHRLTRQCLRKRGWAVIVGLIAEQTATGPFCRQHAEQMAWKHQEEEW